MSLRRQCYEWRNVAAFTTPVSTVSLNQYPVVSLNRIQQVGFAANTPIDIFIGGIGNNIDIPGQLKAFQYIVIDAVAVYPPTLHAQIYVNTTKYFQDPDGVPSRKGGISGLIVPFPNGANTTRFGEILNYDYKEGLQPAVIIKPNQVWGVEVTSEVDVDTLRTGCTDLTMRRCFVKYLLIDGADSIVAKRLLDAGWPLTVENIWKYKQDLLKTHLIAGLAPLPDKVAKAKRKV